MDLSQVSQDLPRHHVELHQLAPGEPSQQPRAVRVEGQTGDGPVVGANLETSQEPLDHLAGVEDEDKARLGADF